jgi:hypothetical protein
VAKLFSVLEAVMKRSEPLEEGLARKLRECKDCLAHLRTRDEDARRRHPDEKDDDGWKSDFCSPYEVDEKKILCSKGIRREKHKAQVIVLPRNTHTRDRLMHSFDALELGETGGMILGLNVHLIRAGLLGHDLGHTPSGHRGEKFLAEVTGKPFRHEIFGVVLAQKIERRGRGLNLTHQTLRVIRNHSRGAGELHTAGMSPEETLAMYCDKIAYVFSDINDLFMRNSLTGSNFVLDDFPVIKEQAEWFGKIQRERTRTCIVNLCLESAEKGVVSFQESEAARRFAVLKKAMYDVYHRASPLCSTSILHLVHEFLGKACPDLDPALLFTLLNDDDVAWIVGRAGEGLLRKEDFSELGVSEIACALKGREIDLTDPDLDW